MTPANQSIQPLETGAGAPPVIASVRRSRIWRWLWWGAAGLLGIALAVLFLFNPAQHAFYPFCAFHRMTGLECPGCGGLRAVHHLLRGEVVTAFRFNPLVMLSLPVLLALLVRRLVLGPRAEPLSGRAQARWAMAIFIVLVVFWIVRNLPLEMFRLPAG
jgi:hypothetical protein